MSARARLFRVALALAAAGGGAYVYSALRTPESPGFYQGYVEGESIRVGGPVAGTLATLSVRRGQTVRAGDPLFAFDVTAEAAARDEAAAALRFAEAQYKRQQELIATRATPAEKLDAARNAHEQARAALVKAERRLAEMAPKAPADAIVEDTMALPGDFLAAGTPVVSLLPPDRIKLRFFVPGQSLAAAQVGRIVSFRCDGCPAGLRARIVFVSPRAEYTPPVIYSVGSREKLVYMIEAVPVDAPVRLRPGQPVDVEKAFHDAAPARAPAVSQAER
jgi:HlyD family secretion protein